MDLDSIDVDVAGWETQTARRSRQSVKLAATPKDDLSALASAEGAVMTKISRMTQRREDASDARNREMTSILC